MDEIDVEEARLEFLKAQKQKRITEILEENEGLFWVKPKNVQTSKKVVGVPNVI